MSEKIKESAEDLLTLQVNEKTTFKNNGFTSSLYIPEEDKFEGKALIIVGGSDGMYSLTKLIAEQFVKKGLTVLALAYWNRPGLPKSFESIPLEYAQKAAIWLKEKGFKKVGMWGISMGAEYTLLAASSFPELFSCAVAVSPMNVCTQGLDVDLNNPRSIKVLNCSSFSIGGKDIPYAKIKISLLKIVKDSLKSKGPDCRSVYEGLVEKSAESVRIRVEKINGPILFIAADNDTMWFSKDASEAMINRLRDKNFKYNTEFYHYQYASHIMVPYKLEMRSMFDIEKRLPNKCQKSNIDAFEKTIDFLKKW